VESLWNGGLHAIEQVASAGKVGFSMDIQGLVTRMDADI
jgi:hypothetical protein